MYAGSAIERKFDRASRSINQQATSDRFCRSLYFFLSLFLFFFTLYLVANNTTTWNAASNWISKNVGRLIDTDP